MWRVALVVAGVGLAQLAAICARDTERLILEASSILHRTNISHWVEEERHSYHLYYNSDHDVAELFKNNYPTRTVIGHTRGWLCSSTSCLAFLRASEPPWTERLAVGPYWVRISPNPDPILFYGG